MMAMAVLVVSCQKSNVSSPAPADDAWKYDVNLPVPIQFGAPSLLTKAMNGGIMDAINGETEIGLVAVQPKANGYTVWSAASEGTVLLNNEKVSIISDDKEGEESEENTGKVIFAEGATKYYPVISDNIYSFYAYHPYSESAAIGAGDVSKVTYDLSACNTDILWAMSEAEPYTYTPTTDAGTGAPVTVLGFNAKYIRRVNKEADPTTYLPALDFQHLLTALEFKVKTPEGETGEFPAVAQIVIKNVVTEAELVVVDNSIEQGEVNTTAGKLTAVEGKTANFTIAPGEAVVPTAFGEDVTSAPVLLYPADSYTIDIAFKTPDKEDLTWTRGKALPAPVNSGSYKAGYRYVVEISVNALQAINISATMNPWEQETVDLPLE